MIIIDILTWSSSWSSSQNIDRHLYSQRQKLPALVAPRRCSKSSDFVPRFAASLLAPARSHLNQWAFAPASVPYHLPTLKCTSPPAPIVSQPCLCVQPWLHDRGVGPPLAPLGPFHNSLPPSIPLVAPPGQPHNQLFPQLPAWPQRLNCPKTHTTGWEEGSILGLRLSSIL